MISVVIGFRDLTGLIRAHWEMARVRECWNVLEYNGGSARFSLLAARKESGLATGQPSLAAIPVKAAERTDSASLEKLGGANQVPILLWPDSCA